MWENSKGFRTHLLKNYWRILKSFINIKNLLTKYWQLQIIKDMGIAEVKINGRDKGIVCTSPFRVEISDALQKVDNILEIKVVNSFYNRVAGDQTLHNKKKFISTNTDLKHD